METPAEMSWRHRTDGERLIVRSCEALLGLCSGMMADGILTDDEILFLSAWLDEHDNITSYWPGDILASRVRSVLTDGLISDDEREHLKATLSSLIGGTMQDTGATSGQPASLPVNPDANIVIQDKTFCFTGTFVYGTRKKCEQAVLSRFIGTVNEAVEDGVSQGRIAEVLMPCLDRHPVNHDHAMAAIRLIDQLPQHALRTLDAMHLAIARGIGADTIATADYIMAEAAESLAMNAIMF